MKKKPNLILFGIDSLRADHMSLYGYHRLTTPHMDKLAEAGCVFENAFSPSIPTTPGYASMFTGMDCFGTDVVALRHEGMLGDHVKTLAEVLSENGYNTTCVGFSGNQASRGFQNYIDFPGWGSWKAGRSPKAENLNKVAIPELKRLAGEKKPFFLFLRHMDPHSPYLPPYPFERIFWDGDEFDPNNHSLEPVMQFKPFRDYFASWFPPGCTDKDYIIAQYDGALAYMDACIANIISTVRSLGIEENTLMVFDSDHGETLYDHECWFDHHGLYDCTIHIPLFFYMPGTVPAGRRFRDYVHMKDIMPTILDILDIETDIAFDGRSLVPLFEGKPREQEPEYYLTEATWMRKHGWRTPEGKYIHALEPDIHHKPEVELYNLLKDPEENHNVAEENSEVVEMLEKRMQNWIAKRERETGRTNPIYTNLNWSGHGSPFKTSEEAYNTMYIGSPETAEELQAKELRTQRGQKEL
ncbi:MAG: sulfatase-like hydrolase/transferase [Armatimonadetes bacterium]|nr:sulfatase-like hydrolase/transferase [Armatimonadota bacterium]